MLIAINGVHPFPWSNRIAEKQYPEDINGFEDAFRFAAKCAGYKAYLAESLVHGLLFNILQLIIVIIIEINHWLLLYPH